MFVLDLIDNLNVITNIMNTILEIDGFSALDGISYWMELLENDQCDMA